MSENYILQDRCVANNFSSYMETVFGYARLRFSQLESLSCSLRCSFRSRVKICRHCCSLHYRCSSNWHTYLYGTLSKGSLARMKTTGKFYLDCSPYVDPGGNAVPKAGETSGSGVGNLRHTEGGTVCLSFVCVLWKHVPYSSLSQELYSLSE